MGTDHQRLTSVDYYHSSDDPTLFKTWFCLSGLCFFHFGWLWRIYRRSWPHHIPHSTHFLSLCGPFYCYFICLFSPGLWCGRHSLLTHKVCASSFPTPATGTITHRYYQMSTLYKTQAPWTTLATTPTRRSPSTTLTLGVHPSGCLNGKSAGSPSNMPSRGPGGM